MKTLHLTFGFLPDAPGGTELYVDGLCRSLRAYGIESVVVAPGSGDQTYDQDGLRVRRFAASPAPLLDLYAGDPRAASAVGRILEEEAPALVHQHALTPACSPLVTREAKRRGLPVVFTYHTPTATCQRGTLLESGSRPCDGRLDVKRCTACTLDGLGVQGPLNRLLAAVPRRAGQALERVNREGGAWTALRMSDLLSRRHAALRQFFADVDRFVVLAPWVANLLRANGIAEEKLAWSAHGVPVQPSRERRLRRDPKSPVRLVHLGRIDPVKGTDVLIRALAGAPDLAVELDIYGIVQGEGEAWLESLRELRSDDRRVRFHPAVPHEMVSDLLADYDLAVVPSQWMETGPLVVLEAFAAGVPVVGSCLGGIADKVKDGVDGVLVRPFNSVAAWQRALRRCAEDRGFLQSLAQSVRPPRSAASVALEMRDLYDALIPREARSPGPPARSRQAV